MLNELDTMEVVHTFSEACLVAEADRMVQRSEVRGAEHDCLLDAAAAELIINMVIAANELGIAIPEIRYQRSYERPDWTYDDEQTAEVTFEFKDAEDAFMFRVFVMKPCRAN